MGSKDNYKKLQELLTDFEGKNKNVQECLQKLEGIKKEKENKSALESLDTELKGALENVKQLEKELREAQDGIYLKLGKTQEKKEKHLEPEEQEFKYELKSQLLKNVEMQNQKLKTEFTLHEKMTESRLLSQQNRRLHEDITMSRANSLKLIRLFERKAKEADTKLKEMKQELERSQDLAEKYRNLYELERRKHLKEGEILPPMPDDVLDTKPPTSYSFLGQGLRVNDIIRKNEVLVDENKMLRQEIKRLKEDNTRLVRQTKQAMAERDQVLHRLETSESNRRNLLKRLDKEKTQHSQLSRSLTRQASDWILLKKQIAQFDEEYRWSQLKRMVSAQPIRSAAARLER